MIRPSATVRSFALAIAGYTTLTLLLFHDLIGRFSTAVPHDLGDPLLSTFTLWWNAHRLPFVGAWWDGLSFYPGAWQPGVLGSPRRPDAHRRPDPVARRHAGARLQRHAAVVVCVVRAGGARADVGLTRAPCRRRRERADLRLQPVPHFTHCASRTARGLLAPARVPGAASLRAPLRSAMARGVRGRVGAPGLVERLLPVLLGAGHRLWAIWFAREKPWRGVGAIMLACGVVFPGAAAGPPRVSRDSESAAPDPELLPKSNRSARTSPAF